MTLVWLTTIDVVERWSCIKKDLAMVQLLGKLVQRIKSLQIRAKTVWSIDRPYPDRLPDRPGLADRH